MNITEIIELLEANLTETSEEFADKSTYTTYTVTLDEASWAKLQEAKNAGSE